MCSSIASGVVLVSINELIFLKLFVNIFLLKALRFEDSSRNFCQFMVINSKKAWYLNENENVNKCKAL